MCNVHLPEIVKRETGLTDLTSDPGEEGERTDKSSRRKLYASIVAPSV